MLENECMPEFPSVKLYGNRCAFASPRFGFLGYLDLALSSMNDIFISDGRCDDF